MAEGGVCAVVGVGPGLGLALCRRFGREGYRVAMLARSTEKLAGYREGLSSAGVSGARGYAADAGSPRSLSRAFGEVRETLGEPEVMIYNAVGFLMQVEVDWIHRVITNAKKPVLTIKPLAAGRLLPLVGLAFSWATLRESDMVAVGTMTPDEAREVIDISLSILEKRSSNVELQRTGSKGSLDNK